MEELARKYDTVEDHGWYRNLDQTIRDLDAYVRPGHIIVDYSGGTGILADRLLEEVSQRDFGVMIVDASPKFLRLALEKLGGHQRVAFRWIRYLKQQKRLQSMQEVFEQNLLDRGVDAIVSTNAIHLYYGLKGTLTSWFELLRPGARAFIQSGNIGLANMPKDAWIIDATVEAIHRSAMEIVHEQDAFADYRKPLADSERLAQYDELRRKYFLPVRPLDFYLQRLEMAGFRVLDVTSLPVRAHVDQWFEFLATYHEGVLGWVGGSHRVEGQDPSEEAVADRLRLIALAMERVFQGRSSFDAIWTYITAER